MLWSKPNPQGIEEEKEAAPIDRIINRAYTLRYQLNRFPDSKPRMTSIEFNAVIYLDAAIERCERQSQVLQRELLEANLKFSQEFMKALGGMFPRK